MQFAGGAAILGESPLWSVSEQALYWVDSIAGTIHRRGWTDKETSTWQFGEEVGAVGLCSGGLVVAARSGFHFFDPASAARTQLAAPERDFPDNRLNDGKVDRHGRFWSGSLRETGYAPVGNLWRLDGSGATEHVLSGLTIPNALCWSPDGARMYFADSPTGLIEVFDFDAHTGRVGGRRPFARIPDGRGFPDGATVDSQGRVWSANIDGGRILRFLPDGSCDAQISLPVTRPTSCTLGGPDLDVLFVTTARRRLSEEQLRTQELSGSVLAIKVDAKGIAEPLFRLQAAAETKQNGDQQ